MFVPANNVLAQKETQKYNGQSYIYDFQNEKVYRSQVSVYSVYYCTLRIILKVDAWYYLIFVPLQRKELLDKQTYV